ncbi:MAG: urea carboxylase-associated family protein [Nocardioidaceae bacterium]|nr:urea carboxylase-associated family protein [Nocardioidaceae bacterium]
MDLIKSTVLPEGAEELQSLHIAARGHVAFTMRAGNVVRIVDVEGQQVADLVAFNQTDHTERLNGETTMLLNGTYNPREGHVVYSDDCNPMFTIIDDKVGRNYPGALMCSQEMNLIRYGIPGTVNCRDNLTDALRPWGIGMKDIPGAFTPFMNVIHHPDGRAEIAEPPSAAGDHIDLRAEMDLLVAISACPQERNPVNGWKPSSLDVVVYHQES